MPFEARSLEFFHTHSPRRWPWAAAFLSAAALALLLLPAFEVQTQTADPPCDLYSPEPVPASFVGCADLQAKVEDTAAFMGQDGFDLAGYEGVLGEFFDNYCHRNAASGWVRDKRVRDTGPYVAVSQPGGTWSSPRAYGTHLPVVIWYNPKMIEWLRQNRPHEGDAPAAPAPIPDGAVMVKEMFPAPAARCDRYPPEHLTVPASTGVAFMIRDAANAQDGWFWGAWWQGFTPDWPPQGRGLAAMGFGLYCLNCHASAKDNSTFADLANVAGEPGEPNVYLSQNFLFENAIAPQEELGRHRTVVDTTDDPPREQAPLSSYNPAFLARFPTTTPPVQSAITSLPSQTYDHVWVPGGGPTVASQFVTSDQCIGCHDAGSTGLQFDMTEPSPKAKALLNLSPYATWRTSPMGLGGRDPIFLAQLASETETFHPQHAAMVQNICFGCHGVQGQRQLGIDHFEKTGVCVPFDRAMVDAVPYPAAAAHNPGLAFARYGALARDGIACSACHHMALTPAEIERVKDAPQNHCVEERQELLNPENKGFARTFTGSFFVGPPGELYGPFTEPQQKPMEHALDIQPIHNTAVKSSELCGTCHTVHLPIFGAGGKQLGSTYEQTTYPEWAMSAYRTGALADGSPLPSGVGSLAQSCQGCHMKSSDGKTGLYQSKIASIQEKSNFPATENTLPAAEIDLSPRPGFARHTLVGLNVFFNEMAQQFPDVLGIPTQDPMMGSLGLDPLLATEQAMLQQAAEQTATVAVSEVRLAGRKLSARVTVDNLVGHRFPSGVGFRRAFLEVAVLDAAGQVLWASGRTDGAGTLVDQNGQALAGEMLWQSDCSALLPGTAHQPHYQVVRRQDQAQIYQELSLSPAPVPDPRCGRHPVPGGAITTSFLSICGPLKDNRLLPDGFLGDRERLAIARALGAGHELAEETGPFAVGDDPDYRSGGGGDSLRYEADLAEVAGTPVYVQATLYYQAIPPFYLQDRFCTSRSGDTERLYYLAGHLDLAKSPMESWKLTVASSGRVVIGPAAEAVQAAR